MSLAYKCERWLEPVFDDVKKLDYLRFSFDIIKTGNCKIATDTDNRPKIKFIFFCCAVLCDHF